MSTQAHHWYDDPWNHEFRLAFDAASSDLVMEVSPGAFDYQAAIFAS